MALGGKGRAGSDATLPQADLLRILDFIRGAAAISGPRTFASYVTSELSRIIPSALTGYAELDLVKRSVRWVTDGLDASLPDPARVLAAHISDNPFILYRKRTGDGSTVRLSDLTTARAFSETGLYSEFYRPLHVQHSMACALRLSQRELAAIALYRSGSDFSERDRQGGTTGWRGREIAQRQPSRRALRGIHPHLALLAPPRPLVQTRSIQP